MIFYYFPNQSILSAGTQNKISSMPLTSRELIILYELIIRIACLAPQEQNIESSNSQVGDPMLEDLFLCKE